MFPFSRRTSKAPSLSTGDQLFKRTLALGAGLLLLWLALSIMPKPTSATQPVTFSDEAGTVATSINNVSADSKSMFDLGKITAGLLLVGLLGFAYYWRKKSPMGHIPANSLRSIGKIQLSPNQHVHLIGCGQDALLVGTNNSQITLLHQLPLQDLNAREEQHHFGVLNAPQFSIPRSTIPDTPNFGMLLQQQSLTDKQQLEASKTL